MTEKQSVFETIDIAGSPRPDVQKRDTSGSASDHVASKRTLFSALVFAGVLVAAFLISPDVGHPIDALNLLFDRYLPPASSAQPSREVHPILTLLSHARRRHTRWINSQSKSLAKATSVYKSRYGRNPPAAFADWYSFAYDRNHTLIDEYDALMRDLEPFYALPPSTLKNRTFTLASIPGVSIISIKDGKAEIHSKSGRWAPALAFQEMIAGFINKLPDMNIAINELLEGRVLPEAKANIHPGDWDDESEEILRGDPLEALLPFPMNWKLDGSEYGSTWESFKKACPPDAAARRLHTSLRSAESEDQTRQSRLAVVKLTHNLPALSSHPSKKYTAGKSRRISAINGILPPRNEITFISDTEAHADICIHPSLHTFHSAFYTNTRSIPYLYPLFSPSKPNGFADILIPSHQHWNPSSEFTYDAEFKQGRSKSSIDVDWSEKDNLVYWRGKVTRGADVPFAHQAHFQKQRFVAWANDNGLSSAEQQNRTELMDEQASLRTLRSILTFDGTTSTVSSLTVPLGRLNDATTDVALACNPQVGECQWIAEQGLKVQTPRPLSEAWKHKYVVDVDEVGFSPKFLALMESKSAVLKSTIQREFWNDWIIPWFHYIPLSTSYGELHNIQAFFLGFPSDLLSSNSTVDISEDPVTNQILRKRAALDGESTPVLVTAKKGQRDSINPLADIGTVFNGDAALKDIAMAGSRWKRRHMRREDMEVYVYRLMIEWAALLDESRHVDV